jgi:thiamine kinase-like enzyme
VTQDNDILAPIAALPLWDGRPRFEPLSGGISNLSFAATDGRGKYAVRLTRDFPFHDVYRDREVAVARAAHAKGFAPEVVYAAPGLMISRFIDGVPLTPADVRAGIGRIVELLGRFHREMAAPTGSFRFDVFGINRRYLRDLQADARAGEWSAMNERFAELQPDLPKVFAHHDLLAGNILDDGRRLWLIDFEYSGPGSPMFDLANLSSNASFSAEQSRELLTAYFGSTDFELPHRTMEAASLLREGLWSLVSADKIRERDVDYRGYAEEQFRRLAGVLPDL